MIMKAVMLVSSKQNKYTGKMGEMVTWRQWKGKSKEQRNIERKADAHTNTAFVYATVSLVV